MSAAIYMLISVPSLLIFWEDVKTRMVTIWKIILLLIASAICFVVIANDISAQIQIAAMNFTIVLIIYLAMVISYFLKERRFDFRLKNKIGLADLLIVIPAALCFSNVMFLYFIVGSMLLGLLYGMVLFLTKKSKQVTIPLAGICSLLFAGSFIALHFLNIDFQSNSVIFELFIP